MRCGLVGKTLAHSYSKEIHEALGRYEYELFSLTAEEMERFVKSREFDGLNITIPYKKDVMPLCDEITDLASRIGAVNTLYKKDGRLIGHNTDHEGFCYAASRAGIDFIGATVLILGSGGTSLTARCAARDMDAEKIFVASRSGGDTDGIISYDDLPRIADTVDILVNTTPVGTFPNNLETVIDPGDLKNCRAVIDVIYNPFKTKLLLRAEELGLRYTNGLPMLVAQATAAAGYFLGTPGAFESENERIISSLERKLENIVLIGMPGCGKSTIGRIVSTLSGKPFVDMDREIEEKAGMTIPEIFDKEGEEGFRRRETETAKELGREHGLVIATGGGTVLRKENVDALKQNGSIVHILRRVDTLATKGRPLSKDLDTLKKMERERLPYYRAAADRTFNNRRSQSKKKLAVDLKRYFKL